MSAKKKMHYEQKHFENNQIWNKHYLEEQKFLKNNCLKMLKLSKSEERLSWDSIVR